jgi:cyclophilin family peptidyl-prolyl cis-trans isomerase
MNRILFPLLAAAALYVSTSFAAPPNIPPVRNQVPDYTGYISVTRSIDLLQAFTDPDASSAVRMTTRSADGHDFGNIDIVLFGYDTPITVANFLRYVDEGRYFYPDKTLNRIAPSVIHRSLYSSSRNLPIVIQGGGYLGLVSPTDKVSWQAVPLDAVGNTLPPIKNEYSLSNTTSTIAMAQVTPQYNANGTLVPGTGPDSATGEWFINLTDNGGPPSYFDTVNGQGQPGYCVFGRVLDSTMVNVYAVASLPRYAFRSDLDSVPLRNYSQSDYNAWLNGDATKNPKVDTNLVTIDSIMEIPPMNFSASIDNPAIADVTVSGTFLHITPKQAGTAHISVGATDLDGAQVTQAFNVTTTTAPGRLVNISTRMQVGTGDNVLIGGFIVRGTSSSSTKRLLVRGIGPSLSSNGVANPLADPIIELHDSSGAVLATNDNWQTSYATTNAIKDTGIPPSSSLEAALVATVPATTSGSAYTVVLKGVSDGTGVGLVEIYDLDYGPGSTALNISTRGNVDTGENVMIGGFFIGGNNSNKIFVRGIGPSLTAQGVSGALADPQLELRNPQGTLLDSNDDWQSSPHKSDIQATGIPPSNAKEAALYDVLAPGAYTAILRGGGPTPTGVGLVEIYQLP